MKANEFVKKYGFNGAYKLRQGLFNLFENNLCILSGSVCRLSDNEPLFSLGELKRLVESHDLVESIGGLDYLKKYIDEQTGSNSDCPLVEQLFIVKAKAAIADVESCQ